MESCSIIGPAQARAYDHYSKKRPLPAAGLFPKRPRQWYITEEN